MNRFLRLFLLLLAAHVTGCQSSKPHPADERPGLLYAARSVGVDSMTISDSMTIAVPTPGLFRRLFPFKSTAATASMPRKCKGCTFNYVQGNQSTSTVGKKATAAVGEGATSTSTTTGKKSGPAVIASDSVDLNSAGPNSQQVTTTGNGNQVDAKKQDTTQEAPGFWATIAKPLGHVGAGAAALAGCYLLYLIWGFLPRRKKDDA